MKQLSKKGSQWTSEARFTLPNWTFRLQVNKLLISKRLVNMFS